jgi:hypothetical protein
MQRRIITTTLQAVALIICMTAGWHVWPLAIGLTVVLGLHAAGYRMADDRKMYISDAELYKWLNG